MCPNFYMLYYIENTNLTECRTCGYARYKSSTGKERTLVRYRKLRYFSITLRLQRLFKSPNIIEHMIWHHSHNAVDEVMMHPFNGEAWNQFSMVHLQFLMERHNICVRLCIGRFNTFGSFVTPYSCWLVILKVYNLLSEMCMRPTSCSYLWSYLMLIVYVELRPLIDEMNQLWLFRTLIYDISSKLNFQKKVALMWTINDFHAYEIVFG